MRKLGALLFLVGLAALLYFCLGQNSLAIEDDVRQRATVAVDKAGLAGVKVDADGRDVLLTGQVSSDDERKRAIAAAKVWGALDIHDDLQAVRRPTLEVTATETDETSVQLTGKVPNASTKAAINRAAVALWGAANVQNKLEVAKGGSAKGLETSVVEGLGQLHARVGSGTLRARQGSLSIQGTASDKGAADAVRKSLEGKLFADTKVDIDLRQSWNESLLVKVEQKRDEVVVSGVFPDVASRDAFLDHVRRTLPKMTVVDKSSIAGIAAPIGFAAGARASVDFFDQVSWATVEQDAAGLRFSALGKPALRDRIHKALKGSLPTGTALEVSVEPPKDVDTCQSDIDAILKADTILFNSGSAKISSKSHPLLGKLAGVLSRCPGASLAIQGHTDSQGAAGSNQTLSSQRANAVKTHLIGLGMDDGRATAAGFGETKPVATNDTPAGRAKNRRIEFVLTGTD